MFAYSYSDTRLVNWVFQQVSSDYDTLFPQSKGWEVFLQLYYTRAAEHPYFLVTVADAEECITFLPLDEPVGGDVKEAKIKEFIDNSLDFKNKKKQLIVLSSENYKGSIEEWLEYSFDQSPILILTAQTAQFLRGNFDNPRLEFRLSKLLFEGGLIPDFIRPGFWHYSEGGAKASTFQYFLHCLYKYWLKGEKKVVLSDLIPEVITYWDCYSKKDRREIISLFHDEIKNLSQLLFRGIFKIYSGKDSDNKNSSFIKFDLKPEGKKVLLLWIKKQNKAVNWLRASTEQITVDKIGPIYT